MTIWMIVTDFTMLCWIQLLVDCISCAIICCWSYLDHSSTKEYRKLWVDHGLWIIIKSCHSLPFSKQCIQSRQNYEVRWFRQYSLALPVFVTGCTFKCVPLQKQVGITVLYVTVQSKCLLTALCMSKAVCCLEFIRSVKVFKVLDNLWSVECG